MDITEKIGNKVRILREINNYTQEYVANVIDISPNTYSLLEKGKTSLTIDRLEKIAHLYNISVSDLINFSEQNYFGNITNSATHNFSEAITINNGLNEEERKSYKENIARLQTLNDKLMTLIDKLTNKLP